MKNIKLTHNLAWGLVLFGGIVECFWASGLKYSDNLFFTHSQESGFSYPL